MTNTNTDEYLCADCGSNLLTDGFISSVCPACGGINPITRQDYREYADAVDTRVGDDDNDDTRLVVSKGIEGVALTDGSAWVHCKNPEDTQANL